jgi:geranylgeranyl diphosphate synthase type II
MGLPSTYKEIIESELKAFPYPSTPSHLYEPIRYLIDLGGKRIRPLLTLMGATTFDENAYQKAIPAALAIEFFHNFSLMHDDIMDQAPLRRGQPTVHQKWSLSTGILSGDILLIMAYQQLCKSPTQVLPQVLEVYNQMATEVCEGQQLDMDFETMDTVQTDAYLHMIKLKTSVLLGASLQLGAIIAGASTEDQEAIYTFGTDVGMAFQLQDDLLDTYGNPTTFGKQVGGDILSNKKTFLYLHALEAADQVDKAELLDWFSRKTFDPSQKVSAVKQIYDRYKVQEATELLKNKYIQQAYDALLRISVSADRLIPLRQLSEALLVRSN